MRIYRAGSKFIAIHSKGKFVYSAQGDSEDEAREKCLGMIELDKK